MSKDWLIVKRDLYFRPDRQGYTGIRDLAGRYSYEEAKGYADNGCSMVKLSEAPEFSKACHPDISAGYMRRQRDLLADVERAAREYFDHYLQDEAAEWEVCMDERQHERAISLKNALDAVSHNGRA